jgi:membrane protease YdiL (CAAX protease family)
MNQETGFRGLIMTGLLRLRGAPTAYTMSTLLFLVGPLHGPGLIEWISSSPGAAIGYGVGVIVHGVAYSWVRHRSDNVVLCAILHGIINGSMNGPGLMLRAMA